MKKVALLIVVLIFITLIFNNKETPIIKDAEAQIYLGTGWSAMSPIEITVLNSTTWTDLTTDNRGSWLGCYNDHMLIVIAKSTALADTAFAAGKFALTDWWQVPDRQSQSLYKIYAKCDSADISTKTLANAAAVDKGVTPEKVGIPVLLHGWSDDDFITISGSAGGTYDGLFMIISETANEIVIYHPYTAVVFAGTETAVKAPTVQQALGR